MKKFLGTLLLLACLEICYAQSAPPASSLAHTFSIVARDPHTGEMGVAVQSHWFSVGTSVSWAEAGVGAIATQSFINKSFGPRGLAFLRSGLTARETLDTLLATDPGREVRQVGIVDKWGHVAGFTGKNCIQFASDIQGTQFSVQSNMMLTDQVCRAMAEAFQKNSQETLAERLMMALEAGQRAGGDIRGRQSAALVVVAGKSEGKPWEERLVDLRVDDSPHPIAELHRLLLVHMAYDHMNAGDLAVEKDNMEKAMNEYGTAMKMMPDNLEMQYWTAITLANNKRLSEALPMLRKVFAADPHWKELTRRLPAVNLLTVSPADLQKILSLK